LAFLRGKRRTRLTRSELQTRYRTDAIGEDGCGQMGRSRKLQAPLRGYTGELQIRQYSPAQSDRLPE
jgi:hypothetical protein